MSSRKHIFISYSRRDSEEIDKIKNILEVVGFDVWLDRASIGGGDQWDDEVGYAIIRSDVVIIALSRHSVSSDNVKDELNLARSEKKRIIPVLISSVELPAGLKLMLARYQMVDMRPADGIKLLVSALKKGKTDFEQAEDYPEIGEHLEVHPSSHGKYSRHDVFTPTSTARLTFVEREQLNEQLLDALRTPGMQVAVYGPSGSGKTTLLQNKLEQLARPYITSRCTNDSTFYSLVRDCFNKLATHYALSENDAPVDLEKAHLSKEYITLRNSMGHWESRHERDEKITSLPPGVTVQRLAEFLGAAKLCWVIEDFHSVDSKDKVRVAQSMKVFMDEANSFESIKIIVLGASNTARQVIEHEPDMRTRVSEVLVPLMEEKQIREIIRKGEALLNVSFDEQLTWENRAILERPGLGMSPPVP